MNDTLKRLFSNLIPFLMLGMAIALLIGLFLVFSYVIFWGFVIGGVLWLVSAIRDYFRPKPPKTHQKQGRIIEHRRED